MQKILVVSVDEGLLYTRGRVLESTGASVERSQPEPALQLLATQTIQVVVLCHTLSDRDEKRLCTCIAQAGAQTRIVLVTKSATRLSGDCGEAIAVPWRKGPQALLDAVTLLLRQSSSSREQTLGGSAPPPIQHLPQQPAVENRETAQPG